MPSVFSTPNGFLADDVVLLLPSWDLHDVLCRLAWLQIGRRVENVHSNIGKPSFSTSINNRESCPCWLMRRFTKSGAQDSEANVNSEFFVERVMSPSTRRKKHVTEKCPKIRVEFPHKPWSRRAERAFHDLLLQHKKHTYHPIKIQNRVNSTVFRIVWMVSIWRRITPGISTALPTNRLAEIDVLGDLVDLLFPERWHASPLRQ